MKRKSEEHVLLQFDLRVLFFFSTDSWQKNVIIETIFIFWVVSHPSRHIEQTWIPIEKKKTLTEMTRKFLGHPLFVTETWSFERWKMQIHRLQRLPTQISKKSEFSDVPRFPFSSDGKHRPELWNAQFSSLRWKISRGTGSNSWRIE